MWGHFGDEANARAGRICGGSLSSGVVRLLGCTLGLPASVAALVSSADPQATVVDLVNLDPEHDRTVIVQAGAFAEHTLQAVRYTPCPDRSRLGGLYDYGHREPAVTEHHAEVRAPWLTVRLPAPTRVRLTLTLTLQTRPPSYTTSFDGDFGLPSQAPASPTASQVAGATVRSE